MQKKVIAIAVVGVVLMSATFFFFHPYYPSGQALSINNPPPPPKVTPPKLTFFQNQTVDIWNLGRTCANITNFNFSVSSGNTNSTVEGYIYGMNGSPLADVDLYVAEYPVAVYLTTSTLGFYQFHTTKFGSGHILIKPRQYHREPIMFSLTGNTVWQNLTFNVSEFHTVSGYTISTNGSAIPGVQLFFNGTMASNATTSNSNGFYRINLYNDTYQIADFATGYTNVPSPNNLVLQGKYPGMLNLTLNQNNYPYSINGKVVTLGDYPVPSAIVTDGLTSASVYSKSTNGSFSVGAKTGSNVLVTTHAGFQKNVTSVQVSTSNIYNLTILLLPLDPFFNGTLNGTASSPTNSSSLNYSNVVNGTSTGYVFGWNGMPVADQNFTVGIKVNGSIYQSKIRTNSFGMYGFRLEYAGYYNISFSSPIYKTGCLSFHLTTKYVYKNVTLKIIPTLLGGLSGSIINRVDNLAVQNATFSIFGGNIPSINVQVGGGTSGSYYTQDYPGYYNLNVTGPGFTENLSTAIFPSAANSVINVFLNPARFIGQGMSRWNVSNGTGIPSVPATGTGSPGSIINDGSTFFVSPISILLNLSISGKPASNIQYELYASINGVQYRVINQTNQSGVSVLKIYNAGKYEFLLESLNYYSIPVYAQILSNQLLTISLQQRSDYRLSVIIANSYNQTHGISNESVPVQLLNITNSLLTIFFYVNQSLAGTNFSAMVPDGTYNLSYINPEYVNNSTSVIIKGGQVKYTWLAIPYLLIVNYNTVTPWGVNIKAGSTNIWNNKTAGSGAVVDYLYQGSFNLYYYFSGYSSYTNSTVITLSKSTPQSTDYYNLSNQTTQLNFISASPSSSQPGSFIFTYAGTLPLVYLFAGNDSLSFQDLQAVSVNGIAQKIAVYPEGSSTAYFSFSPIKLSGGVTVEITSSAFPSLSVINIFYYSVSLRT